MILHQISLINNDHQRDEDKFALRAFQPIRQPPPTPTGFERGKFWVKKISCAASNSQKSETFLNFDRAVPNSDSQ
jgi:hypothetical protein